ncbi:hypothetical protein ACFXG6_22440 [Streptomyces roseus]|uniref:hypothetical protein n=1 Tax=Streptomyces roseus TaxID=66430 RepID=UPI0036781317
MKLDAGVTRVHQSEVAQVAAEAVQDGALVLTLSTGGLDNRERVFDGLRRDLPMDPPNHSSYSWEALSDSLFGGLWALEASHVVVVWRDALQHESLDVGVPSEVLLTLEEVAEQLGDPQVTRGPTKILSVLVPV